MPPECSKRSPGEIEEERKKNLTYFANYIQRQLGIIYQEHNYFQLENRLNEIVKLLGKNDLNDLYQCAQGGIEGQFKQLLLDLSTNNETSFFRDEKAFRAIEATFLSDVLKGAFGSFGPLRIWSAASSTGQEAVSMAILLEEFFEREKKKVLWTIEGTDISDRVLSRAREGSYTSLEVQRGLPAKLLIKYFNKENDPAREGHWVARDEVRRKMKFQALNLKESFTWAEPFHLILCRNVLIYQNVESKKEILGRMVKCLLPGGYLILGSGESLLGLSQEFDQQIVDGAVVYRRKNIL